MAETQTSSGNALIPSVDVPKEQQAWIRFMAPVIPQTVGTLFQSIDQALAGGAKHLHLMISSPGGSVFHGLSAHTCADLEFQSARIILAPSTLSA